MSEACRRICCLLILLLHILDQHDQWNPERQGAAIHTFNAIMYSIQVDLSYILIERILVHLDRVTSVTAKGNNKIMGCIPFTKQLKIYMQTWVN